MRIFVDQGKFVLLMLMKYRFIVLDYPSLRALAAVVREGTFERAAATLRITPSAISQRVRGLEERLGAVLVIRGQPCEPTDIGRTLCAHLDRVRLLEHDITPLLGLPQAYDGVAPILRIAVNADSLATWFPAAAATFGREADVRLDFVLDDEAHTADRLRSGEVLAAVTAEAEPVQGCRTMPLGALRYLACASPAFIQRHAPYGIDDASVAVAPSIRFDRRDALQQRWARETFAIEITGPVHLVPSTHAFLDLALEGLGWALHPQMLVEPYLADGRLIELVPGRSIDVLLYWTVARLHAALLKALTDSVRAAAREDLIGHEKALRPGI